MKRIGKLIVILFSLMVVFACMTVFASAQTEEKTIEGITYQPVRPIELYEGYDEDYYEGYIVSKSIGDILILNFSDGTTQQYVYTENVHVHGYDEEDGDEYDYISDEFVSPDGTVLPGSSFFRKPKESGSSDEDDEYEDNPHWGVGEHDVIFVYELKEIEYTYPMKVSVIKPDVKSVEYIPVDPKNSTVEIVENTHCYEDTYGEHPFTHYSFWIPPYMHEGDQFKVTFNDSSKEPEYLTCHGSNKQGYGYVKSSYGKVIYNFDWDTEWGDPIRISFEDNQSYENPWTPDNDDCKYIVDYLGTKCEIPVRILPNNVSSISFEYANLEMIENVTGRMETDWLDDGEDYSTKVEFFVYDVPNVYSEGNRLTVTGKDGSKTVYTCKKNAETGEFDFYDEKGNCLLDVVSADYYQGYYNQWTPDNPGKITIKHMGCTCEIPVIIKKEGGGDTSCVHEFGEWKTVSEPTCSAAGSAERLCTKCNYKETKSIPALGHTWGKTYTVDKAATYAAAGSKSIHCTVCGAVKKGSAVTIPKLKVNAAAISKLTPVKKGFTAKWKKVKNVNGYEVQYSLKKNFKGAKTVKITKATTVSRKVTKLNAKKKYFVRIRAYKTVKGKKYYSSWSKAKSVTTKK